MAVSYEVVEEDGTKLWDGEIAYHNLSGEVLVECERLVQDLIGNMKAVTANVRVTPQVETADGGTTE
jgi:hypothetical protein